jgi:hypothetical protein
VTGRPRPWVAAGLLALVAAGVTGCDNGRTPIAPSANVTTLIVSEAWMQSAADDVDVQGRLASLQGAIKKLREETGSGWIGRQDDVTGYLADLSGGSRVGAPEQFMDAYGPALFGVDSIVLDLAEPDTETVPGMVSTRATQTLGTVPVRDAELVFTSRAGSSPRANRVTGVRGRVFPGLTVTTEPQITRHAAALIAADASGGRVTNRTTLVVLPTGEGVLAWEVTIAAGPDSPLGSGLYYVDALTGDLVDIRPTSVDGSPALGSGQVSRHDPDPNSVEVTGVDPYGTRLTSHGLRRSDGIAMTDTTTPAWDSATGKGGVFTYDATGLTDRRQLPGRLVVNPDTEVRDPDVIAAQTYGRAILDYYAGFGRNSWDDNGASLVSSVHWGTPDYCNEEFDGRQMLYGNPCISDGKQITGSVVAADIAGHEVTHGVTQTSARLVYSGQPGALNESFSDYFGNVIGNLVEGNDTNSWGEDSCTGMPTGTFRCVVNPDGSVAQRYLLNGNDYDEYLRLLNTGARALVLTGRNQDNGGVHFNSQIMNNALWSIRTQLAKIDNLPGNDSPLARSFDRAVYGALTTGLAPTSGFVDARAAVEHVVIESGLDPVVLRVTREVFDANKICAGCASPGTVVGDSVTSAPQSELHPSVSGDRVAWLNLNQTNWAGQATSANVDGSQTTVGSSGDVMELAFGGKALLTLDARGRVERTDPNGASTVVANVDPNVAVGAGFVGSDAGAAWADGRDSVSFVAPEGTLVRATVPGLAGDKILAMGTGGGYVAIGTSTGKVFSWHPGSGEPVQVGTMPAAVTAMGAYGGNVLAIADSREARLFGTDGTALAVSKAAVYFGAAMSADYAVWTEATGELSTGVRPGGGALDTDLYVMSLATGKIYNLLSASGQQGFPSLSGRRLVWQDAVLGGDDIRTFELPAGL